MSDYGANIELLKKDRTPLTDYDKELIKSTLESIKQDNEFSDVLGDDFLFEVREFDNDNTMVNLVFSEYWNGEGDEEENFEFAKDNDLGQVEEIAEKLKSELGQIFEIKPNFENW